MRAYHMDLRERVLDAYNSGQGTIRSLAELYKIGKNTVQNWLSLFAETGTVEPRPHGGGVAATISDERLDALRQLVAERNDASLDELHLALEKKCSIETSRAAVGRALAKAQISRKRRRSMRTSSTGQT